MVVVPDGCIHARAEMRREELLVAAIDIDRATRAMFEYNSTDGAGIFRQYQ